MLNIMLPMHIMVSVGLVILAGVVFIIWHLINSAAVSKNGEPRSKSGKKHKKRARAFVESDVIHSFIDEVSKLFAYMIKSEAVDGLNVLMRMEITQENIKVIDTIPISDAFVNSVLLPNCSYAERYMKLSQQLPEPDPESLISIELSFEHENIRPLTADEIGYVRRAVAADICLSTERSINGKKAVVDNLCSDMIYAKYVYIFCRVKK